MLVTICLTELVNKINAKSNIRRMVNQIKHRLALITYQIQNCDLVLLDTQISIDRTGWYQLQRANRTGVPSQQDRHLQFPRHTCHVSLYHVTCLTRAVFVGKFSVHLRNQVEVTRA